MFRLTIHDKNYLRSKERVRYTEEKLQKAYKDITVTIQVDSNNYDENGNYIRDWFVKVGDNVVNSTRSCKDIFMVDLDVYEPGDKSIRINERRCKNFKFGNECGQSECEYNLKNKNYFKVLNDLKSVENSLQEAKKKVPLIRRIILGHLR